MLRRNSWRLPESGSNRTRDGMRAGDQIVLVFCLFVQVYPGVLEVVISRPRHGQRVYVRGPSLVKLVYIKSDDTRALHLELEDAALAFVLTQDTQFLTILEVG